MTEITMPKLSDSMEEGTILTWLKQDGQPVARDDDLVEIETDKATITYVSEVDGMLQILAGEGTSHPVGAVIARVGPPASLADDDDDDDDPGSDDDGAPPDSEPQATNELPDTARNGDDPAAVPEPVQTTAPATPLARRAAQAHRVDLGDVRGTGPGGRITRSDVLAAAGEVAPPPTRPPAVTRAPAAPPQHPSGNVEPSLGDAKGDTTIEEPSGVQRLIARRMTEAQSTIPAFEVQIEVVMDESIDLRARLKELGGDYPVPSFNDLIIKASALALRRHPRVNASYADGQFQLHGRVNVGFAVATDDALIVPTVYDADTKSLASIVGETQRLAERVRSGQITPPELAGGTFTVSNLGMFGMSAIRPVINAPQVAILGVGAMRQVLARADGQIVDRTLMTLTLSSDHRILYGADAARFLADIGAILGSPLRLAL